MKCPFTKADCAITQRESQGNAGAEPDRRLVPRAKDILGPNAKPISEASQTPAQQDMVSVPKVWGVSRMFDNPKALLVCFDSVPTDDELRAVQDVLAASQRKGG